MKNLVILIGRIASAPETRHAGETAITSFTLVTDRPKLVDGKTVKNEAATRISSRTCRRAWCTVSPPSPA